MMEPNLATKIATRIGQALSMIFAVIGLVAGNPFLVLIAMFVFFGASQEAFMFRQRAVLTGHTARQAMISSFEVLRPQESLAEAARHLNTTQQDFPVVDAWDRVSGILSRSGLVHLLAVGDGNTAVLEVMEREVTAVAPDTNLELVLDRLMLRQGRPVFVVTDGRLLGMVTLDNVTEFIELNGR